MTPIEQLKALLEKATPLYPNPSVYFDKETDESVANLFSRDTPGECVVQVRGDYACEWAKALVALPDLLALAEAAQVACQEETRAGIYHEAVKEQRMDKLRAALSRLTTNPQKDG